MLGLARGDGAGTLGVFDIMLLPEMVSWSFFDSQFFR